MSAQAHDQARQGLEFHTGRKVWSVQRLRQVVFSGDPAPAFSGDPFSFQESRLRQPMKGQELSTAKQRRGEDVEIFHLTKF